MALSLFSTFISVSLSCCFLCTARHRAWSADPAFYQTLSLSQPQHVFGNIREQTAIRSGISSPAGRSLRAVRQLCIMSGPNTDIDDVRYEHHLKHRGNANQAIFLVVWTSITVFVLFKLFQTVLVLWRTRRFVTRMHKRTEHTCLT